MEPVEPLPQLAASARVPVTVVLLLLLAVPMVLRVQATAAQPRLPVELPLVVVPATVGRQT